MSRNASLRGERTERPYPPRTGATARPRRASGEATAREREQRLEKGPRTSRPSREETPRRGAAARSGRPGASGSRNAGPKRASSAHDEARERARAKGWGSVARKGAANITSTGHELVESTRRDRDAVPAPLAEWQEEAPARPRAASASERATARAAYALPGDVAAEVRKAFLGTAYMREKMVATLTRAAEAYDRHRYEEALRLGRIVADAVPGVAPVRELAGLAAYRAERWAMAKAHLRVHFSITGDPEHLPLVMDADRALRRYRAVEKTFEELTEAEPTAEVLAEARIVLAATWADQRRFDEAIELLVRAGAAKPLRNPSFRHLRLWYALADVYDRAGDATAARELFARVVAAEPDAYDAAERLAELGAVGARKNRKRRTAPISKKRLD